MPASLGLNFPVCAVISETRHLYLFRKHLLSTRCMSVTALGTVKTRIGKVPDPRDLTFWKGLLRAWLVSFQLYLCADGLWECEGQNGRYAD